MVNRMKARTPSGVLYRVGAHPHGLLGSRDGRPVRWHVTVKRLHGVDKPTVRTEIVEGLLPPLARMRALAAEIAAPPPVKAHVPQPRVVRDRVRV